MGQDLEQLREKLKYFKRLTEGIIDCVSKEQLEQIEKYLNERQKLIDEINLINYDKQEFINVSEELGLLSLESLMNKTTNDKKIELKNKMIELKDNKNANKKYLKNSMMINKFINKKI